MRSLQARMFLVFALIATLPLLAMSYLALNETRQALGDEVGRANGDAAQAAAGFVDVYVENGRVLLEAEARGPALREAAASEDAGAILLALQGLRERATYQDDRVFERAIYYDESGDALGAYPAGAEASVEEAAHRAAFTQARATGAFVRLAPPPEGNAVVPMGAPVFVNGTLRGVLVADLGLAPLSGALSPFAPGDRQVVFITDAQGRLLAHPDAALAARRPDYGALPAVERALAGDDPAPVEYDDPETGERTLAATARLPRLGWIVVNAVPTSVAYSGLERLAALLVVLSGLLAGGILLAGVAIARRIVAPIQELTAAARALSAGNLAKRIEPRGEDEIAELARTFNEMAERISESLEGLRRSEARYRGLVESASDFIFTIQPDGELSFVSPMTRRMLGEAAAPGKPAHLVVAASDRDEFASLVRRVVERGEPALWVPLRLSAADGGSRAVLANLSPIFDGQDKPTRVLAVAHDVTEERRQEQLREKAFQMARLVSEESALEALAHRGLLLLIAAAGLQRGGVFLARGDQLREIAASPRFEPWMAELAARARTRAQPIRERAGEQAAVAVPLLEHGEVLGVAVLSGEPRAGAEDATELLAALAGQLAVGLRRSLFEARLKEHAAQLETRVAERTAELTRKSDEMEQFLYSVSHDLKAPLISIQGYAQGLEEDYATLLQGDGAQYLERIRKNASLMESLILDILELSRIGRTHERVERVDMGSLLGEIAARLSDRVQAAGGALVVQPGLPEVEAEPRRLAQLFTNLVDNAIKYRDPQRPLRVEVTGEVQEREAVFHVKDNGRGIPARLHDQLFKIFTRVPTPGMEDPGGTGMGLAIVKRIAETQGGRAWVESEEGVGTTFHVALPRRR